MAKTIRTSASARAPRHDGASWPKPPVALRAGTRHVVAVGLLGSLLVCAVGSVAVAQLPQSRDPARLRAGIFLYASPSMGDPRFAESVVLLLDHGRSGSAGVVVNQPGETSLRKVLPEVPEARRLEVPVYWGGPVQPEVVTVLLRNPRRTDGSTMVLAEVYRTTELEVLRAALEDPRPDRQVRVYSGYAGWSPGQLEKEVRLGAWLLDRADADEVFTLDPEPLWERVHAIMRRLEARQGRPVPAGEWRVTAVTPRPVVPRPAPMASDDARGRPSEAPPQRGRVPRVTS